MCYKEGFALAIGLQTERKLVAYERKGARNLGPCRIMASRALTLREGFLQITLQLDGLPRETLFIHVIGVITGVVAIGFACGYWYASRGRVIAMMKDKAKRNVGTQSQCTYKWKCFQPRFQVLPQQSDGVFDIEMNFVD